MLLFQRSNPALDILILKANFLLVISSQNQASRNNFVISKCYKSAVVFCTFVLADVSDCTSICIMTSTWHELFKLTQWWGGWWHSGLFWTILCNFKGFNVFWVGAVRLYSVVLPLFVRILICYWVCEFRIFYLWKSAKKIVRLTLIDALMCP